MCMDSEKLYQHAKTMITSSTNTPKYMSISTVKVGDLLGVDPLDIERGLEALVNEGRLQKSKLPQPPHYEVYQLP